MVWAWLVLADLFLKLQVHQHGSVELVEVMSANGALTKSQRKKCEAQEISILILEHLSKVFQIIKPLLLTLHSRRIFGDQDEF